jgi:peptidoglycan/xylan/chitin deacetylase (PgdA/CDA1 family)
MRATVLSIRFDIDTLECVAGLPSLLRLAERLGVQFSFYANLGRSISHVKTLRTLLSAEADPAVDKLPTSRKMSRSRLFHTVLANPRLAAYRPANWRALDSSSHEVGLHGGRNHAAWQAGAERWSEARLRREVEWGVKHFCRLFGRQPRAFASPGWNSPGALPGILADLGFDYYADAHEEGLAGLQSGSACLANVNTNILGMPGNVGFFEHADACGLGAEATAARLLEQLAPGAHNVVYDHPGYISRRGMGVLERAIEHVVSSGVVVATVENALRE